MSQSWTVEVRVPETLDVEQAGETVELDVAEDETILAAARSSGLWLPADCQQGWCVTCAAKLVEGEVDQTAARRYFEEDDLAGFILPCTAKPRQDCVIEAGRMQAMLEQRAEHDQPPGSAKLDS